ncbi:TVP38/TMEM64 family protein [Streptococcus saliviloxodontae]|uniref:TVP38/TMEM64 family membrane protein n=1 Tax=Streptococcus saliviloxodontae TaxID=1349416 RepID=A0ABS2PL28_9STRE|nr:TVP38/TMEM64 family protein [Streptococcus saliviloxodontae]MBM7636074.1 putative membrane protein YdjX (TVP38/TMEM64 family) [Streptococcus saliviloxodontae]
MTTSLQDRHKIRFAIKVMSWIVFLIILVIMFYLYSQGYITDKQKLQAIIKSAGVWGPLLFVLFQIFQVIVPILPGGVSSAIGVVIFGTGWGFLWNYIGICLGSFLAFHIAKTFGRPILHFFFKPETIAKYETRTTDHSRFSRFFALAIFIPIAPDDLLCLLAGTTSMSYRRFMIIILLGKPLSIYLYSMGLVSILGRLLPLGIF